jgi:hypothetical protein
MEFIMVVILDPGPEGFIEIIEMEAVLDIDQEALPNGSEESFNFSTGRAVIGFGVDQGDTGQGAAFGQQIGRKAGPIIDIKSFRDSIALEGLFKDRGQGAEGFGGIEGVADDHPGMIIQDGTEDGFTGTIEIADRRAMHKVTDPEVVDIIGFEGFTEIGAMADGKPTLGFNNPKQGIVVNGGITE